MRALALCVVVLAVASLAASVEPARACSCVPPDPWSLLKQADGAFVGRLVSRRETDEGRAVLTFRVERAVKGKIGRTVEVTTANNGAACGIETAVGQRIGLFLAREGDGWVGHLCWQVAPEDLLAAAALPAPNGKGPVAMFVGGRFGPASTIALDAKGRTLAYGMGAGETRRLSVCPGEKRVAELVDPGDPGDKKAFVAIREVPAMRLVREQPLKLAFVGSIRCMSTGGDRVIVFAGSGPDLEQRARLVSVTPNGGTTVWRGWAFYAWLADRLVYVTDFHEGLLAVDPANGSVKRLAPRPRDVHYLIPNAQRTRFASLAYTEGVGNPRLVVVDTGQTPAQVRKVSLKNAAGGIHWLPRDRLVLTQDPTALVFGSDLQVSSRFRWLADDDLLVGLTLIGVQRSGRLVSAKLPSGQTRLVRRLPGRPHLIVYASG